MRLIACHIENFGKLSNLSVEFSDGINVINESNAWGKSTLAAFLKVMFYGLDAKKDPRAFDKERNVYRPWQGGVFGGEVDFEVDGRCYRISRSFGATEKTDEFHLYDLSTNLESEDYSEEIGLELFELDSASFKRSIYIAQNDCASTTSDSINAKLGNLADNGDDIDNFEAASNQMKALILQLTPDRVTGSIKKRKGQITQLEQEIRTFESARAGLDGIREKEIKAREQIEELQGIRKDYTAALVIASEEARRKELYVQYDALCEEVNEKETKVEPFKAVFPEAVPTQQEFEEQMKKLRLMEDAKTVIRNQEFTMEEQGNWEKLSAMFAEEKPTGVRIDAAISMLVDVDKQKQEIARQEGTMSTYVRRLNQEAEEPGFGNGFRVFQGLGIGMLIVGIIVFAANYFHLFGKLDTTILTVAALFAVGVGMVFLGIGLFLMFRNKKWKEEWKEEREKEERELESRYMNLTDSVTALKEEVRKVNETIDEFLGKYHVYSEVKDFSKCLYELKNQLCEYERLAEKKNIIAEEEQNYDRLATEVMAFAMRYDLSLGEDMITDMRALQNKAMEYQMAEDVYRESLAKKEEFESRQEKSFWTREMRCPYSVEELNTMIQDVDKSLESLKSAHAQYSRQMEELQEQLDLCDEKTAELQEARELQESEIRKYNLVSATHEFLQKAKEQLTARYMEPIAAGFAKYYQMLTGNDDGNWQIDANINLKVHECGELRETKWLSAGYQDLIGVCMRLALADAMYPGEKPFLILDDPFVNLDEEKVMYGNQLLLAVAEEYQVIYFTCHDSRSPL